MKEKMKGFNMRFTLFGMLGILLWGIALDGAEKIQPSEIHMAYAPI